MSASALPAPAAANSLHFDSLPPLGLYVHLPWCVHKCPYCDFNSYEARGPLPEREYVQALLADLGTEAAAAQGRPVASVFIGGGTPSLFSGAAIRELLAGVRGTVELAPDVEITLEANPAAVEAARFAEFRAAGVDRLSIGIQSWRSAQLRALGRAHDAEQARAAVASARGAGFDNINLDLMYGLPGDDVVGSLADLEAAIALRPTHVSWYQLTLEPNTAFERRPPALPHDDVVAAVEEQGRALLASTGFDRYEISAYAQPGRRCRHNVNYWSFGDYLGVGAGAHGKVTLADERVVERRAQARNPRTYMGRVAPQRERVASPAQVAIEFMMNALRLVDGVDIATFVSRAGQPIDNVAAAVAAGVARGWLRADRRRLGATPAGLERLNRVLELFV
jgi:oxygen-independent coproporphyrinogen-3 oxidase